MNISIITDSVVEDQAESFIVRIDHLPMSATDMVTVSPQTATVFIFDGELLAIALAVWPDPVVAGANLEWGLGWQVT